jgi:hypothetical protein
MWRAEPRRTPPITGRVIAWSASLEARGRRWCAAITRLTMSALGFDALPPKGSNPEIRMRTAHERIHAHPQLPVAPKESGRAT